MNTILETLKNRKEELSKLTYDFVGNKWQSLESTILDMLSVDNDDTNLYSFVKYITEIDEKHMGLIEGFLIESGYVIWSYNKIIKELENKESVLFSSLKDEEIEKIAKAKVLK